MPEEFHRTQWAATAFSNEFLNGNVRPRDSFLVPWVSHNLLGPLNSYEKKEPGHRTRAPASP
jgi:hypothetical protein